MSNRKRLTPGPAATLDVTGQERVRPERARRGRVEKVWRCVRWAESYPDESLTMNVVDLTPTFALRKLAVLFDGGKIAECAALVRRLSAITLESILGQLPVDILHDSLPSSLPVLEAIYVKVSRTSPGHLPTDKLRTDQLIQRLVALFAKYPLYRPSPGQAFSPPNSPPPPPHPLHPPPPHPLSPASEEKNCNLHIPCCRSILRVIMDAEPNFRRTVAQRKRTLVKCLRRMGKHGLVGGSAGKSLVSLHEALRAEFERQVALYRGALQKLEQLSLVSNKHGNVEKSVSARPAPTEASHQRLMQVTRLDVQERVIKNKTLLNSVELAAADLSLQRLLRTLRARVESDKLLLFHHTELRKMAAAAAASAFSSSSSSSSTTLARLAVVAESSSSPSSGGENNGLSSETQQIATTLHKFCQGYAALLRLAREVVEAQGGEDYCASTDDVEAEVAALSDDSSDGDEGRERGVGGEEGMEGDYLSVTTSTLSIMKKMKVVSLNGIIPLQPTASTVAAPSPSAGRRARLRDEWLNSRVQQQTQQTTRPLGSRGHRKREAGGLQTTPTMEHGDPSRAVQKPGLSPPESPHQHHLPHNSTARKEPLGREAGDDFPAQYQHQQQQQHTPGGGGGSEEMMMMETHQTGTSPTHAHEDGGGGGPVLLPNGAAAAAASVAMLEQEVLYLRQELANAREQIRTLQGHEKQLRDRLVGQAHQQFQLGGHQQCEDVSLGSQRPAELIRRYGDLYLDSRVEALDALDHLGPLRGLDVLKLKILFSVVVLSFKSTQQKVGELRGRLRHLLGLPVPSSGSPEHSHPKSAPHERQNGGGREGMSAASEGIHYSSSPSDVAAQMEHHITAYLCKTADSFEVAEIVFEVCQQIYATLYDYPCLKACAGLLQYVSHCVRLAWALGVQRWPYTISYDSQTLEEGTHARFHTSDPASVDIRSYMWPALVDSQGVCVSRAVVIT